MRELVIIGSTLAVLLLFPGFDLPGGHPGHAAAQPSGAAVPDPRPDGGLSEDQIEEARGYYAEFQRGEHGLFWSWPGWNEAVNTLLGRMPERPPFNVARALRRQLDELGGLVVGCWVLPDSVRPVSTTWLEDARDRLDESAARGADGLAGTADALIDDVRDRISQWCRSNQSPARRAFCPCP